MSEESKSFSAGAQALVNDAQRLGLTWDLRPATVGSADPLKVTVDADTIPVNATSMVGALTTGRRVYVLLIPPSGVFIVGFNDPLFTDRLSGPVNLNQAGIVGSTTSATYVNFPNQPFVTVHKSFESTLSNIWVDVGVSLFSSATATVASFALNLTGGTGTDVEIMQIFINPALTHTYASFTKLLTGLAPGTYTLSGRWRRVSGAGTLQTDTGDWVSITAQEVWAV